MTELKKKHHHIKRIFVRAEYPVIGDRYENYLLESFEETYFPERIKVAGRIVYAERNFEMINNSKYCVIYYNEGSEFKSRKSGTKMALDYAVKSKKEIILLSDKG